MIAVGARRLQVHVVPALSDNYVYLLKDALTQKTFCVDASESTPVVAAMKQLKWTSLDYILCTHHHLDHIGGNLPLKDKFGSSIVGSRKGAARIPGIDVLVDEETSFAPVEGLNFRIFDVPGHTIDQIAFLVSGALFCGDTLFSMGCGRLFKGTAEQMFSSLHKITTQVPPETMVFCGHEYTLSNGKFAKHLEPSNTELRRRLEQVQFLRKNGEPTIPISVEVELQTNPFLRVQHASIRQRLGLDQATNPVDVFSCLRKMKDTFQ
eukprot:TRINITY_DN65457_c0_g1_i1.p1 TRINITY_DN65457_c0_g1~~TRINITY_DN65457_c0_g1_i1.p1  ORF type:complete len:265 (+),score=45.38 TRINITY_DN65457_c0_g1_i1:28-822(+)